MLLKIGIQVDLAGGYGREALRGVMRYANTVGNWEFVMPPIYSLNTKKTVEPHSVDGVIGMLHSPRSYEPFRAAGIPVVNVARTLPVETLAKIGLPSVLPDDGAIGRLAYDYLRDLGFRQFGFCGHPTSDWSLARGRTFAGAAADDGFPCSTVTAADKVPIEWVVSLKKPCAILAGNDRYAWHTIDACREVGIRVPEDVAILGVDNDVLLAEMVRPTLSSVTPDALGIGFAAAELLAELIAGRAVPTAPELLPPEGVVTRHSTDVLAMDDPDVVAAARFIRENAAKPISVDDVMQQVSTSRRNLERRFRRELGRSLLDEIRRMHLARAMNLLRNTDLDIPAVARESGFTGPIRFSTVFREFTGMPPTQYRREQRVRRVGQQER
jgi:LacI family transcriptional regulator